MAESTSDSRGLKCSDLGRLANALVEDCTGSFLREATAARFQGVAPQWPMRPCTVQRACPTKSEEEGLRPEGRGALLSAAQNDAQIRALAASRDLIAHLERVL